MAQFINKRFASREAALEFIDTLPIATLRYLLADYMMSSATSKIVISEEDFNAHFRIRGKNAQGTSERRGRPKK